MPDQPRKGTPPAPPSPTPQAAPVSAAIYRLARLHRVLAAQLLRDLELHPGQEVLLMELDGVEFRSQSDLVRTLMLDHSTVAKSLRRLEIAGFVFRRPSGSDRRSVDVSLTPRGAALLVDVRAAWERLERETVRGLSAAERSAALRTLEGLERAARDGLGIPDDDA
jgi:DNA-binding MarR family transcriptional regulator